MISGSSPRVIGKLKHGLCPQNYGCSRPLWKASPVHSLGPKLQIFPKLQDQNINFRQFRLYNLVPTQECRSTTEYSRQRMSTSSAFYAPILEHTSCLVLCHYPSASAPTYATQGASTTDSWSRNRRLSYDLLRRFSLQRNTSHTNQGSKALFSSG